VSHTTQLRCDPEHSCPLQLLPCAQIMTCPQQTDSCATISVRTPPIPLVCGMRMQHTAHSKDESRKQRGSGHTPHHQVRHKHRRTCFPASH
jgi:hypothetical protein